MKVLLIIRAVANMRQGETIASSWFWSKIDFSEEKILRNSCLRHSALETCLVLFWSLAMALIIFFLLDISQQWTHCAADEVCKITFTFTKNVLMSKKSRKNFTRILVFQNTSFSTGINDWLIALLFISFVAKISCNLPLIHQVCATCMLRKTIHFWFIESTTYFSTLSPEGMVKNIKECVLQFWNNTAT